MSEADSRFQQLAQAAEQAPASVDFRELRAAYVQSSSYPTKHITQPKLMQISNHAAGFEEVASICTTILQGNPMDLEARMMLGVAQERLGQPEAAARTRAFVDAMIDAILSTGDGKGFETAFQVVAEAEEWTLMKVFGLRAKSQAQHQRPEGIFRVYSGKIAEREVEMVFDTSLYTSAIDRMIGDSDE